METILLTNNMDRYNEDLGDDEQPYVHITEIVVPTEHDKEQLLKAFEYIHYLEDIDPDFMAVNVIMHLYLRPEMIKVVKED